MKGEYIPFNDGFGIVGFGYKCPKCGEVTQFTNCDDGCANCGYFEKYEDPDDWYDNFLGRTAK